MTLKASSDLGHSPPSACSLLQVKLKRGLAPRPKLSQRGGTDRGAAAGSAGAEERLGDLESGQLGSGSHLCLAAAAVWRRTVWRDLPAAASGERREDETRGEPGRPAPAESPPPQGQAGTGSLWPCLVGAGRTRRPFGNMGTASKLFREHRTCFLPTRR